MSKDDKDDKDRNKVVAGIEKTTEALAKAILDVVAAVPKTNERFASTPRERARAIQTAASLKAAAVSGTLALPSGPLSFAVILPDLISVWRIQAKMVAGGFDIFVGGSAGLKDNKGATVIPAGKAFKQQDLELEKMNYLVEGVIGSV